MSEKRKGHIDPKTLDLYQKLKHGKDRTHFTYGKCIYISSYAFSAVTLLVGWLEGHRD